MNQSHSDTHSSPKKSDAPIEERIQRLEHLIEEMNRRNYRVDLNKKWETSATRFMGVTAITYITMNLILWSIGGPYPPIHALVPTCGYMLSTLSLQRLKKYWITFETRNEDR